MTAETKAIVRAIYDAWREKDLAGVAGCLDDDFCFHIHIPPTVHPLGGPCHGKAAALERLRKITQDFEFLAYEIGDLIVTGERAATQPRIRYVHKPTGEELETTLAHFWTLRGGKAVRLDEYHDMGPVQSFAAKVVAPV